MEKEIQKLNDDELDQVSGGFIHFNGETNVLTYTQEGTGRVYTFQILDYAKAWEMSNLLHAQNMHEDNILGQMMSAGYIV